MAAASSRIRRREGERRGGRRGGHVLLAVGPVQEGAHIGVTLAPARLAQHDADEQMPAPLHRECLAVARLARVADLDADHPWIGVAPAGDDVVAGEAVEPLVPRWRSLGW